MHFLVLNFWHFAVRRYEAHRAWREEIRTARIVADLPYHLRRDIGLPNGYAPERDHQQRDREPVRVLSLVPGDRKRGAVSRPETDAGNPADRAPARKRIGGIAIS